MSRLALAMTAWRIPIDAAFDDGKAWTAWIDYDGNILEVRVSGDGKRPFLPNLELPIRIPDVVGRSKAYVGFTGSTGDRSARMDILTWDFDAFGASALRSIRASVNASALPRVAKRSSTARLNAALRGVLARRPTAACGPLNAANDELWKPRHASADRYLRDGTLLLAVQLGCRGPMTMKGPLTLDAGHICTERSDDGVFDLSGQNVRLAGYVCAFDCSLPRIENHCGSNCIPGQPLTVDPHLALEWAHEATLGPWRASAAAARATLEFT